MKAGGNLGNSGSVAFLFDQKGIFEIPAEGQDEDELFLLVADAGAEDLRHEDDLFVVETPVEAFGAVQAALTEAGIEPEEAGLQRLPTTTTTPDTDTISQVLRLLDTLDEHQDVQAVYSTLEVDEDTLASLA